jgi:hypothetical protein
MTRAPGLSVPASLMRPRRAVLQIPIISSVLPRLTVYKSRHLLTPSESTLLQVLIPLHFISFISNTYKKPGGGFLLPTPKFCNSLLPEPHPASLSLYYRYLITSLRHRPLRAHSNTRNPSRLYGLLHDSLDTRGGVRTSRRLSNFDFRISSFVSAARRFPRPRLAVSRELSLTDIKELALLTVQSRDGWIHHHQALHVFSRRETRGNRLRQSLRELFTAWDAGDQRGFE